MFEYPFNSKKGKNKNHFDLDIDFGLKPKKKKDCRRTFTKTQKKEIWAQQNGKCARCHKKLDIRTVKYHHGKAWAGGGKTIIKNGRALHSHCHDLEHHEERLKKHDKKRKKKKRTDSLSLNLYDSSSKKKKKLSIWDL